MPKKCENCGFFRPENELSECPECGQALQFTMFAPPDFQMKECTQSCGAAAWNAKSAPYKEMELSVGARITQIGAGIGVYWLISGTINTLFCAVCFVGNDHLKVKQMVVGYFLIKLTFHIIGALVGGAVAGAWSKNWVPQGIGVGLGVFVMPFILYSIFGSIGTNGIKVFLAIVCITTVMSVFGAFIGHKIVRPHRFTIS